MVLETAVAVQEWFYKAAAKHLPNLIEDLLALDHERVWVDSPDHQEAMRALNKAEWIKGAGDSARVFNSARSIKIRYEPVRKQSVPQRNRPGLSLANTLRLIDHTYGFYRCAVDRRQEAQLFISLEISSVFDLMTVTVLISVQNFPDFRGKQRPIVSTPGCATIR
uniref:hypothetical protein n=1 Tax=Pseudomonas sp. AU10 TaxID=882697 RepID=UPI0021E1D8B9